MKNILTIALITSLILVNGCIMNEGPRGPQGVQGPKGDQGPAGESSYVFEFDKVNFTAPNYEVYLDYPKSFEGLNTDVALVYLLWGTDVENGDTVDVWRQLPQTVIHPYGHLIYNYDFTKNDVRLFLNADFPLDSLTAVDTDQWIVRVVVVPGNVWTSARMDRAIEYKDLANELGLADNRIKGKIIERRDSVLIP